MNLFNKSKREFCPAVKKILSVMKWTTVLLIAFSLNISANIYSQTTKLSLNVKNQSVKNILYQIENQSDFQFIYESGKINLDRKVSIQVKEQTVETILKQLFENEGITYEITENNLILINPSQTLRKQAVQESQQAKKKVTGIVKDQNGEPIIGANVVEKGTTNGTVTDVDGKFSLEIAEGGVLTVSYIGYTSRNLAVGNQSSLEIQLREDTEALDEVVVIGYGTVRKSDLTGSVSQIRSDILENQAVLSDPIQGLQGKVAGLDVTIGNKPGDTSTPIIRGYNSINAGNDPLIVLDGAPFGGKISDINPAEIEAIDVLKDASSTAIYGSRGSNGVIIMTTKRGKMDGKVSISYDGFVGISKSFKDYNMMSGDKWADFYRAANSGKTDEELFVGVRDILESKNYVDWQDEMFSGTGYQTDNNVTINVGKGNMSNLVVLGYNKNQSIIENMSSERFSMRLNGDVKLFDRLKLSYSAMYSHRTTNNGNNSVFLNGTVLNPVTRIYEESGSLQYYPSSYCESYQQINPKYYVSDEYLQNQSFRDRAFFNFSAELDIIKGLSFRTSLTPDFQFIEGGSYNSPYMNLMSYNSLSYKKTTEKSLTFTNILKYDKQFGVHNLSIMICKHIRQIIYN